MEAIDTKIFIICLISSNDQKLIIHEIIHLSQTPFSSSLNLYLKKKYEWNFFCLACDDRKGHEK